MRTHIQKRVQNMVAAIAATEGWQEASLTRQADQEREAGQAQGQPDRNLAIPAESYSTLQPFS